MSLGLAGRRGLSAGHSQKEITAIMGRAPATIARTLKVNIAMADNSPALHGSSTQRIQEMYDLISNIDKIVTIPAPVEDDIISSGAASSGEDKSDNTKKPRPKKPLTENERYRIHELKRAGHSQREIAAIMGRSPSTINRALKQNSDNRALKQNSDWSGFWIFGFWIFFVIVLSLFLGLLLE